MPIWQITNGRIDMTYIYLDGFHVETSFSDADLFDAICYWQ